jgi:hypothetical protein
MIKERKGSKEIPMILIFICPDKLEMKMNEQMFY